MYQVYQKDQDQNSGATYISDVVFKNVQSWPVFNPGLADRQAYYLAILLCSFMSFLHGYMRDILHLCLNIGKVSELCKFLHHSYRPLFAKHLSLATFKSSLFG